MNVITFLQQLQWREPLWLLLALQPLLLWLLRAILQNRRLGAYADAALQPWVVQQARQTWRTRLLSRNSAYVIAWLLFAIATAGPRLPLYTPQADNRNNMNIMVVMDVSRSMLASDIRPNRLRRAELELHELLKHAAGQRVGLIVFAARPHLFVPLTWDFTALHYYLRSLDKLVLPTRGSQLTDALTLASDQLVAKPQPGAIVLFTDGDLSETDKAQRQDLQHVADNLRQKKLPLYIIGIGSSEGAPIPLQQGGWLSDEDKPVISRMDEALLLQLAVTTHGRYSPARDDDSDWRRLYDNGVLQRLPEQPADDERLWQELYPWALSPALLLFFAAVMPFRLKRDTAAGIKATALVSLALLMSLFAANKANAENADLQDQAFRAYQQQRYDDAAKDYAQLKGYQGRFGEGAAFYRMDDYLEAQRQFSNAVLQADNDRQRADALFNLGNSYFKQGDYKSAARSFADVLRYQDNYPAARKNLSISRALYQQVVAEIARQESASRAGRGPRTTRPPDSLSLNESLSASINETQEDKPPVIPDLPDIDPQALQDLIDQGIEHIKIAARGKGQNATPQQQQSLARARLFMLQLEDQSAILWQSLFEREEGFAAPQSQPNVIPGVKPW
jgi:Ca-activated chloride channel family protein